VFALRDTDKEIPMRARTLIIVTSATLALAAPAAQAGLNVLPAKKPALAARQQAAAKHHKTVKPATTYVAASAQASSNISAASNRSGTELTAAQSEMYATSCEDDVSIY
jgi:hypothetical protein